VGEGAHRLVPGQNLLEEPLDIGFRLEECGDGWDFAALSRWRHASAKWLMATRHS
jgi:hypothetical protein